MTATPVSAIARKIATSKATRGRESKKPAPSTGAKTVTEAPSSPSDAVAARASAPSISASAVAPASGSDSASTPSAATAGPLDPMTAALRPVSSCTRPRYSSALIVDPTTSSSPPSASVTVTTASGSSEGIGSTPSPPGVVSARYSSPFSAPAAAAARSISAALPLPSADTTVRSASTSLHRSFCRSDLVLVDRDRRLEASRDLCVGLPRLRVAGHVRGKHCDGSDRNRHHQKEEQAKSSPKTHRGKVKSAESMRH